MRIVKYIVVGITIINLSVLLIQYVRPTQEDNYSKTDEVNMGESSSGDIVLITKSNTLLNFPIVFGTRLYEYHIKTKKWKLVRNNKIGSFNQEITKGNDTAYYMKFFMDPGIDLYQKRINFISMEKKVASWVGLFAISGDNLFYTRYQTSDEDDLDNPIYKKNMVSNKKKIILRGKISDVLRIDKNFLYTYDAAKREAIELDLNTNLTFKCSGIIQPYWIGRKDKKSYFILTNNSIILYNKQNRKKVYLVKNREMNYGGKAKYKKGLLYYFSEDLEGFSVNPQSGENKKIISLRNDHEIQRALGNQTVDTWITYCDNYIVVDLGYYKKNFLNLKIYKKKILIFDYKGKMVRKI